MKKGKWPKLPNLKTHKLSKSEIRELKVLRAKGLTYKQLGKHFGITDTGAMYHCNSERREKVNARARDNSLFATKTQKKKRLEYSKQHRRRLWREMNLEMRKWQHPEAKRRITDFWGREKATLQQIRELDRIKKLQKELKLKRLAILAPLNTKI